MSPEYVRYEPPRGAGLCLRRRPLPLSPLKSEVQGCGGEVKYAGIYCTEVCVAVVRSPHCTQILCSVRYDRYTLPDTLVLFNTI